MAAREAYPLAFPAMQQVQTVGAEDGRSLPDAARPRVAGKFPPDARGTIAADGARGSQRDVRIGSDVWIGARAVVLGGSNVGHGAVIGAAVVVDGEVPDYAVAAGNPARIVGWARPATQPTPRDRSNP